PTELRSAINEAIAANPDLADTTTIYVTRDFLDLGPLIVDNERQTFRVVTGFEGSFGNGIDYELSYNYGRTSEELLRQNARIEDRFFAAIDVVTDANGDPICRSELDPSAPPPPTSPFPFVEPGFRTFSPGDGTCKPLNIFGNGAPSEEAIDFVTTDFIQNQVIDQQVVSLIVNGDSKAVGVRLPAGPIAFAGGGEYRHEYSRFRPDEFSEFGVTFDGTTTTGLEGSYFVYEGFGELSVPILAKLPGAQALNLDGAMRYAAYSTIGSSLSWKIGSSWTPISDVRVRGGYSQAVRAPNVAELFQAETSAFFRPVDPCDAEVIPSAPDPEVRARNCADDGIPDDYTDPLTGRFAGVLSGNPDLSEETAKTFTLGAVLTPSCAPGLIVAVDYFDIELEDAIDTISSQDILNNCYDNPGGLDNQFCELFTRNRSAGSPTFLGLNFVRVSQLNLGKKAVSGIDFEATYNFDLARVGADPWGDLNFRVFGTWLRKLDDTPNQDDPDFINPELKEIRRPEWVVNTGLRWERKRLTLNYNMTFMSDQVLDDVEIESIEGEDVEIPLFDNPYAGEKFIHDLSASFQLHNDLSIYGGVNNFTNTRPLLTSTSFPVSPLGRVFFLGVTSSL
ncbi:MAG: TonB-dependent receptor, partial [Myxococcota bacterium]